MAEWTGENVEQSQSGNLRQCFFQRRTCSKVAITRRRIELIEVFERMLRRIHSMVYSRPFLFYGPSAMPHLGLVYQRMVCGMRTNDSDPQYMET